MSTIQNKKFPRYQMPELVTYNSDSELKNPLKLLKQMSRDIWASRSLACNLLKRDISAAYRQSFLGIAWAIIPSVLTALTFSVAANNNILNIPGTTIPYPAYVLFSVLLWQTFAESVIGPVTGLNSAKSFIAKINFSREAIFLSKVGEVIFNFSIKCVLIGCVFVYFKIVPHPGTILAIAVVVCMIILGTSIGIFLAPFNIVFHDIIKSVPIILLVGMFVTPVVYPMPRGDSLLADIIKLNPLTYLISGIRDLTITGSTAFGYEIVIITLVTIITFFFAWIVFRLSMPYIIERCQ